MARAESRSGRDAEEQSTQLPVTLLFVMTSDLISDHLLYLIRVVTQGEVDVCVHAAELDCSLVIGPGRPENKVYSNQNHIFPLFLKDKKSAEFLLTLQQPVQCQIHLKKERRKSKTASCY
jgi:hypothetical protein